MNSKKNLVKFICDVLRDLVPATIWDLYDGYDA